MVSPPVPSGVAWPCTSVTDTRVITGLGDSEREAGPLGRSSASPGMSHRRAAGLLLRQNLLSLDCGASGAQSLSQQSPHAALVSWVKWPGQDGRASGAPLLAGSLKPLYREQQVQVIPDCVPWALASALLCGTFLPVTGTESQKGLMEFHE